MQIGIVYLLVFEMVKLIKTILFIKIAFSVHEVNYLSYINPLLDKTTLLSFVTKEKLYSKTFTFRVDFVVMNTLNKKTRE